MGCSDASRTSPVLTLSKRLLPINCSSKVDRLVYRVWPGKSYRRKWLDLQNTVWQAMTGRPVDWDEAWFEREFSEGTGEKIIWLALQEGRSGGTLMGSVVLDLGDPSKASAANPPNVPSAATINWLAVLPEWRRGGIGSALVCLAETEAWRRGRSAVQVETLMTWQPAVQLYRRMGYSIDGSGHRRQG